MNKEDDQDGLSPKQYGGRKDKSAGIQSLNNCLLYNLIRQKIVSATSTFSELIYNYNLEVRSMASLSLQRVYVPKEPTICTFVTLQNMIHSVKT